MTAGALFMGLGLNRAGSWESRQKGTVCQQNSAFRAVMRCCRSSAPVLPEWRNCVTRVAKLCYCGGDGVLLRWRWGVGAAAMGCWRHDDVGRKKQECIRTQARMHSHTITYAKLSIFLQTAKCCTAQAVFFCKTVWRFPKNVVPLPRELTDLNHAEPCQN